MSGTIRLIYKGFTNVSAIYRSPHHRREIIESWRRLYGMDRFNQCAIQIRPDIKVKKVESIYS